MFDIINVPLGWIMRVCYSLVNNYLFALLLFCVIMQLVLLPFSIKQQKNSVRQAQLGPKVAALRKKYAGRNDAATQQKMQEELQELYRRENFNPASGCLPLLIQMPILFSLYNVVMNPLRYISGLTAAQYTTLQNFIYCEGGLDAGLTMNARNIGIEMLEIVRNNTGGILDKLRAVTEDVSVLVGKESTALAATDLNGIAEHLETATIPSMEFLGIDLSVVPQMQENFFNWFLLIPILTVVFQLLTQKITRMFTYQSPEALAAQKSTSMRIMNWSMPLLSAWIAWSVPSAIGIYWIFRNIIAAVQQIILFRAIPTPKFTEEDYKRAEKEMKAGRPAREKSKIPPRSLHHIDDEVYQEEYKRKLAEAEREEAAEKEQARRDAGIEVKKDGAPALKTDDRPSKKAKKSAAESEESAPAETADGDAPTDGENQK